jgi:hypothetical protein
MSWFSRSSPDPSSPSTAPSGPTRVGQHFPLRVLGCEKQSLKLFDCIENVASTYTDSAFPTVVDSPAAAAGAAAAVDLDLVSCKALIQAYDTCTAKNITTKRNAKHNHTLERVPIDYRYVPPTK